MLIHIIQEIDMLYIRLLLNPFLTSISPSLPKKAGIYLHIVSIDKEQSCNVVKRDSRDI